MEAYLQSAQALKSTLQSEYNQFLASNHVLADNNRMRSLRAIQAGWIFLAAVDELHHVYEGSEARTHLTNILVTAKTAFLNPCKATVSELSMQMEKLTQCMDGSKKTYTFFAKIDMAADVVSAGFSFIGVGYGMAILLGFSGLALGPFGALSLGVGIFFVSTLLASCALEDMAVNRRFCNGSQLQEMNAYIDTLQTEFIPSLQQSTTEMEAFDYTMLLQVY